MSTCVETVGAGSSFRMFRSVSLDGKPTTVSYWNPSTRSSSAAAGLAEFAPLRDLCFLFPFAPHRPRSVSPYSPALTKSNPLTSPKATSATEPNCRVCNPLSIHELLRAANRTGIDKIRASAYANIQKGLLRCGHSAARIRSRVPRALFSGERAQVLISLIQRRGIPLCAVRCGRFPDHVSLLFSQRRWGKYLLECDPVHSRQPCCPTEASTANSQEPGAA